VSDQAASVRIRQESALGEEDVSIYAFAIGRVAHHDMMGNLPHLNQIEVFIEDDSNQLVKPAIHKSPDGAELSAAVLWREATALNLEAFARCRVDCIVCGSSDSEP
jgi:hypothetical protein